MKRFYKRNGKYVVQYKDAYGVRRTATLSRLEDANLFHATQSRKAALARHGIISRDEELVSTAETLELSEHISAWDETMRAQGGTTEHRQRYLRLAQEILLEGCKFRRISSMKTEAVQRWIAAKSSEWSSASRNHAVKAVRAFSKWLLETGRSAKDQLILLRQQNVGDTDRQRGLLTSEEFQKVIAATRSGPKRYGMSARDREIFYLLKFYTGLRTTHLARLRPEDFSLTGEMPHVVRRARGDNKSKRKNVSQIPLELAQELMLWLRNKRLGTAVFDVPKWRFPNIVRMWRADMKAAGVLELDASGGLRTFGSLRHTAISMVVRNAGYKAGQEFAGHSTPLLTLQRYTILNQQDREKIVSAFPAMPTRSAARALHTPGNSSPLVTIDEDSKAIESTTLICDEISGKHAISEVFGEMGRAGIEPATHGFSVHCSTN